ncbi:MAG: hypothetical protein J7604_12460 [Sporocytophaga sp.]|uniref:DUF7793 family protein n=1 Tax=Sporocytophaga sp. TaxID=2231183 RepID=UPI001B08DD78|nr:hypothetical protein [Sporocytophaga sp.]MBO9701017.1 hypothetical protein [Sporocytophaga sp.]
MIKNDLPSVFENDYIKMWIEDGVLWAEYKEIILRLKEAKKIVSDRIIFQKGAIYPAIADIRKIKYVDREANEYLSKEGNAILVCVAIIVESHVSEILGNFYLRINKPLLPTKLFRNVEKAKAWVESFI